MEDFILHDHLVCENCTFFSSLTGVSCNSCEMCAKHGYMSLRFLFLPVKFVYFYSINSLKFCGICQTCSAQELEKELHDPAADSLPAEKRLVIFGKNFTAYHEARSCICSDLV
jgi:hypothetical protein